MASKVKANFNLAPQKSEQFKSLLVTTQNIGTVKCVDTFFISDPKISLTNKNNLLHFHVCYMCIVCYK